MDISIGSDPEVMLASDNKLVSALNHVKARKYNPLKLASGARMLADNVNLEINPLPANDPLQFVGNIALALSDAATILPGKKFLARASAVFPDDEMSDPEACVFGCDPEFSAWRNGGIVRPPLVEENDFFRSCGGHIHIGFEPARKNPLRLIQNMDLFVGVPCVLIDHDESSAQRTRLYGGAGKFRPTSYGVEYRSPTNYWLRSPGLASMIYSLSVYAIHDTEIPASADAMKAVQDHDPSLAANVFANVLAERLPRYLIDDILRFTKEAVDEDVLKNWEI